MPLSFSQPLIFTPLFKKKIWGGSGLQARLNKKLPADIPVGESWEISGWGDNQTIVATGEHTGKKLGELFTDEPRKLAGACAEGRSSFPLLFKFIDAARSLSVQVHPNQEQARSHGWGESGKTECWYIVDARPGAQIIVGFRRDVTRDEVDRAVKRGTLESLLNYIQIKAGDVLFIPAGTVHAILGGTLIYEVQEESDTTLRLYDWNRCNRDGKKRELHVKSALEIAKLGSDGIHKPDPVIIEETALYSYSSRCRCSNFALEEISFCAAGTLLLPPIDSFRAVSVIAEEAEVACPESRTVLNKGDSVLVPAQIRDCRISGRAGGKVLITTVPDIQ